MKMLFMVSSKLSAVLLVSVSLAMRVWSVPVITSYDLGSGNTEETKLVNLTRPTVPLPTLAVPSFNEILGKVCTVAQDARAWF